MINKNNPELNKVFDIAIIGGGVSGLYAGTRILGKFPKTKIVVIEKDKDVGGRLKSQFFIENPEIPVEHGGMRFSDKHLLVYNLISELNLKTSPFTYDLDGYVLRGKSCPATNKAALTKALQTIYNLKKRERNKTPEELVEYAVEEITQVHNLIGQSELKKSEVIRKLIKKDKYKGVPYYKINWSAYLFQILSTEAISLIKATEGYNSNFDNISASEGMRELYRFNETFFYLNDGYQALVKELKKKFLNKGGKVMLNSQCLKLGPISKKELMNSGQPNPKKKSKYFVKIQKQPSKQVELVNCNKVILSLPKNAIRNLDRSTDFFNPSAKGLTDLMIDRVQEMKSLKIYIQFEHTDADPWTKKNLNHKKIFSDGAIRMFYILGDHSTTKHSSKVKKTSVGLVYIDQSAAYEMPIPSGKYKSATSKLQRKHLLLIEHLQRHIQDLIRIYKKEPNFQLPKIKNIAYTFWDEAYHCFIPQVDANITIENMIHPVEDDEIFICGSAYSSKQSWVEGALLTTEYMLNNHFNVNLSASEEKYLFENLFL